MTLDVTVRQRIARLHVDVAAFVFDPANDTAWIGGIQSARIVGEGPVRVGASVARVARFMGKTIEYVNEIIELAPGERLVMRSVVSPFPMRVTYAVEESGAGCIASVRVEGDASPLYGLATPFLSFFVKRNVAGDLRRLRRIMER